MTEPMTDDDVIEIESEEITEEQLADEIVKLNAEKRELELKARRLQKIDAVSKKRADELVDENAHLHTRNENLFQSLQKLEAEVEQLKEGRECCYCGEAADRERHYCGLFLCSRPACLARHEDCPDKLLDKLAAYKEAMRPEVRQFAEAMEAVLKENDYKGGWDGMEPHELSAKLAEEYGEAFEEMSRFKNWDDVSFAFLHGGNHRALARELIDVANVCMMLCDRLEEK